MQDLLAVAAQDQADNGRSRSGRRRAQIRPPTAVQDAAGSLLLQPAVWAPVLKIQRERRGLKIHRCLKMQPAATNQDAASGGGSRCGLPTPSPGCGLLLLLHGEVATSPKLCGLLRGCRHRRSLRPGGLRQGSAVATDGDNGIFFIFFICGSGGATAWGRRRAFVFYFHENDCHACDIGAQQSRRLYPFSSGAVSYFFCRVS
jgi:hypothetical protein